MAKKVNKIAKGSVHQIVSGEHSIPGGHLVSVTSMTKINPNKAAITPVTKENLRLFLLLRYLVSVLLNNFILAFVYPAWP